MFANEEENKKKIVFSLIRYFIQHINIKSFDLLEVHSSSRYMKSVCGLALDLGLHTCWHQGSSAKYGRNRFNLIKGTRLQCLSKQPCTKNASMAPYF